MTTSVLLGRRFDALLSHLAEELAAAKRERPLDRMAVVVPSGGLARHVRARLGEQLRGSRGAMLGVEVLTLNGLARRLTPEGGKGEGEEGEPVSSEVHRLILASLVQPAWLAAIHEPEGLLHATFRDLHDAGFGPEHAGVAEERLGREPWWATGAELMRLYREWRALVEAHGLGDRADRVRRAATRLGSGHTAGLARLFWFGLYDLTGAMADLVRAACAAVPGRWYFPAFARDAEPGTADGYLREVYEDVVLPATRGSEWLADSGESVPVELFDASGERAELEEVARRISLRADAEGTTEFSRIAVVARDLTPYLGLAREVFRRFGLPLTPGRGVSARESGRARGVLAVLGLAREGLRRDRLMDALRHGGPALRSRFGGLGHLDAALRAFGVVRDEDFDRLLLHLGQGGRLAVPARAAAPESDDEPTDDTVEPTLSEAVTSALGSLVRAIRGALAGWPDLAPVATHVARWEALLAAVATETSVDLSDLLATPVPATRGAFLGAVGRLVGGETEEPPRVRGIRLLDVMGARGMSFRDVYVVGVNRRRWPRVVGEDPLLPDAIRRILRRDLGFLAMPVKERGHAEEALLFRLACEAATERLTVSHLRSDESGKALVASPFVEELRRDAAAHRAVPRRRVDLLEPLVADGRLGALPEPDLAYWIAVHGGRERKSELCALSPDPGRRALLAAGHDALVIRDAILALPGDRDGLVGPGWELERERDRPVAPTRMEELLRCPWAAFVRRTLGVEPVASPGELPTVDAARLGTLVHAVQEKLVAWLQPAELLADEEHWEDAREMAHVFAAAILERDGDLGPLDRLVLVPAVTERVDGLVTLLQTAYGPLGDRRPGEAEKRLQGQVELEDGRVVRLSARVDRLDRILAGGDAAVDLKTGRVPKTDEDLLDEVAHGRRLQAAFYHWLGEDVRWAGYEATQAGGEQARVGLDAETWAAHEPALRDVLSVATDLRTGGRFVLREGPHCDYCDLTATCLRRHRPATLRLERLEAAEGEVGPDHAAIRRYLLVVAAGVELEASR